MRSPSSPDLETTYDTLSHDEIAAASERSPTFNVAALASVAGFRDSCGNMPLDASIPRRTGMGWPLDLDRDSDRVLVHIDGVRSLEQIAICARLSVPEAIETYLRLLALGVVEDSTRSAR
jgi:hypothetical protein